MNHRKEGNNFDGNVEESENNQAETTGTLTDAVAGAMIGAQFGLIGTVIGGVSGGIIGNQIVETSEVDKNTVSNNHDDA